MQQDEVIHPGDGHHEEGIEQPHTADGHSPDETGSERAGDASDPREEVLIEALAHHASYAAAGAAVGYSERTVGRRMEDASFANRVAARKKEVADEIVVNVRRLRARRLDAVLRAQDTLMELLRDEDPRVRLAAAQQLHSSGTVARALEEELRHLREAGRLEPIGAPAPPKAWSL